MSSHDDVSDYAAKVQASIDTEGDAWHGGAWAKEYARGVAPIAWAIVGLAEELNAGSTEIAEAIREVADSTELSGAIERGLDSAGQEIGQSIERGLSEIAKAIGEIDR